MPDFNLPSIDRVSFIEAEAFNENYFTPLKPVVITDMAKSWPAIKKWTADFFREQHGDKQVKVYDGNFVVPGKKYMSQARILSLREYIDIVTTTSLDLRMFLYNIKKEAPSLVNDITFPSLVDGLSKSFIFMFFGCKESVTQMHFDIDMSHVFHTAIYGKKTISLFPFEEGKNLHRYPFTCRSYVDIHNPDFEQYSGLKKVKGLQTVLEPGETLYIPSGYWHHIVYNDASCAISLRCPSTTWHGKLHGFYNLIIMSTIDRLMNKIAPQAWFNWKKKQALKS